MKLLTNLDLNSNELRNAVLQNLSSAPSSPKTGQTYYSTTSQVGYIWNGAAWRPLDPAALSDASIPIAAISGFASAITGYKLNQFAAPNGNVAMGGYTLTGLSASPNAAGQAAEYSWVLSQIQSAAAGISSKPPVKAVSVANVASLTGTTTIDGVSLAVGDRVLLTAQTTASQNGPWVIAAGTWTRPADENGQSELDPGALWLILQGSAYAGSQWRLSTTGAITPGTTAVTISQFSAGAPYAAGNGLALSGTTFSFSPASNGGLTVSGSGAAVDTTIVARKFSATITGDGSTVSFSVNPALSTTDLVVFVKDSTGNQVIADVQVVSATNVTIGFGAAPANSTTYRVTVIG